MCEEHEGSPAPMVPAVLTLHLPHGELPARGFRCLTCGYETIPAESVAAARAQAEKLGLLGAQSVTRRRITRNGTSAAVNIAPELLAAIGAQIGSEVEVSLVGDRIIIRAAS